MAKKSPPIHRPNHPTLKSLPKLKGGHYRRVKDIQRALLELEIEKQPGEVQFDFVFFACEKLALAVMGLKEKRAVEGVYSNGNFVGLEKVKLSAASMGLAITGRDLDLILGPSRNSARDLRHSLVHDLGPSNVKSVRKLARAPLSDDDKISRVHRPSSSVSAQSVSLTRAPLQSALRLLPSIENYKLPSRE